LAMLKTDHRTAERIPHLNQLSVVTTRRAAYTSRLVPRTPATDAMAPSRLRVLELQLYTWTEDKRRGFTNARDAVGPLGDAAHVNKRAAECMELTAHALALSSRCGDSAGVVNESRVLLQWDKLQSLIGCLWRGR
jgi:hypothetical protein